MPSSHLIVSRPLLLLPRCYYYPHFRNEELKLRGVRQFVQSCKASKWCKLDLNPSWLTSEAQVLIDDQTITVQQKYNDHIYNLKFSNSHIKNYENDTFYLFSISKISSFQMIKLLLKYFPLYFHIRFVFEIFPGSLAVKNLPTLEDMWVWSLCQEDSLEKGMATHSSIAAWEIPWWAEEPGGLQSMGLQKSQAQLCDSTTTFYIYSLSQFELATFPVLSSQL